MPFLEGKAISIRKWASLGSWCSYTGMAEFSEINSWCSQRLSGWLGTIFKAALLGLMQSLKRQSMSALKLLTRFPPHCAWLTQHIQIWDLVLSLYFSKRMYLVTFILCIYIYNDSDAPYWMQMLQMWVLFLLTNIYMLRLPAAR